MGSRRLAEIAKGIDQVDDNTNEILNILKATIEAKANQQVDTLQQLLSQSILGNRKQTKIVEAIQEANARRNQPRVRSTQPTVDVDIRRDNTADPAPRGPRSRPDPQPRPNRPTVDVEATPLNQNRSNPDRPRDSRGRFTGAGGGTGGSAADVARTTNMFRTAFSKALDVVATPKDTSGYDPSVDAINEVSTILAPAARGFRMMGRGAAWLFKRKTKRDEILPEEQSRHNDEVDRHNREERKLLKRIADRLGGLRGGGGLPIPGAGLAGGLLRRGGGVLGKALKFGKGIPLIGTALAAMSLTDWDEKSTTEKGGSVGSIAGGTVGGAVGSLLGPVGTVVGATVGSWAGEKLGGIVAPYVKGWTDDLKRANIPGRITSSWDTFIDGMSSYLGEKLNNAVENTKEAASTVQDKIESLGDFGASVIDRTLAAAGNKAAQERLRMRDQGLIGHRSNVYQAQTSNNAPTPWQTLQNTGKALAMQPATGKYAPLLDEIARGEATGGAFGTKGYDAIYSGAKVKPSKPISQMTVGEVKAYQKQLIQAGSKSTAVGKYQFIHNKGAFGRMAAQAGLKDTDLFDSKAQDRLAIQYAGGAEQLDKWIKTGNYKAMTDKVAQQWASQKNSRGVGNYDGDGLNKARHGGVAVMREVGQRIQENENKPAAVVPQAAKAKLIPTAQDKAIKSPAQSLVANQAHSIVAASNNNLSKMIASNQLVQKVGTLAPSKVKLPQPRPPKVENVKMPVSSTPQGPTKSPMDAVIPQNISDRGLAHALTGGLGYTPFG
ncbi:hypothetical protein [Acinetobacter colistiniresistens]|uniref:hypothetical protein n=2 Tax=Acinetobacter colistiniresistens TaxID=280145 RepID=UPI00124FB122|nr:hypothetical protein [Acinetobacter colistiniresistens]